MIAQGQPSDPGRCPTHYLKGGPFPLHGPAHPHKESHRLTGSRAEPVQEIRIFGSGREGRDIYRAPDGARLVPEPLAYFVADAIRANNTPLACTRQSLKHHAVEIAHLEIAATRDEGTHGVCLADIGAMVVMHAQDLPFHSPTDGSVGDDNICLPIGLRSCDQELSYRPPDLLWRDPCNP